MLLVMKTMGFCKLLIKFALNLSSAHYASLGFCFFQISAFEWYEVEHPVPIGTFLRVDFPIQTLVARELELFDIDHLLVHDAVAQQAISRIELVLGHRNGEESDHVLGRHQHVIDHLVPHVHVNDDFDLSPW